MTTPAQQLGEQIATIEAKVAEINARITALSASVEDVASEQAQRIDDILDQLMGLWDIADQAANVDIPGGSENGGTPDLEPDNGGDQPAPDDTPRIDMSAFHKNIIAGTTVSVPVYRIADGQTLFWHVFSAGWGLLHAENVTVQDSQVTVTIPAYPGPVKLQLQYGDTEKQTVNATIVAAASEPEPTPTPPSEPTPTPPTTGKYEAIARWDVSPEQKAPERIGVVAHHLYGISRVEFSFNGGSPIVVDEPSINPVTGVHEYHVETPKTSDTIQVQATAYPKQGIARTLEPLTLNQPEQIIDLPAGEVNAQSLVRSGLSKGWLVLRGHQDGTTLVGSSTGWRNHVKIQNANWRPGPLGKMMQASKASNDWAVLDRVNIIGNGRADTTWWTTDNWGRSIFTDCDITQVQNIFHGTAGNLLARNVKIHDCYEDIFRAFGLAVNIEIDGIDRGDQPYHPAFASFAGTWTQSNVILQNITGTNVKSQGLAGSKVDGLAVVDCDINFPGWSAFQMHSLKNVLIQDSRLIGGGQFQDGGTGFDGVVFRNSKVGYRDPYLPAGWDRDGVTIL